MIDGACRYCLISEFGRTGFDVGGGSEVERPKGGIQIVAGHIADACATEIPPTAPVVQRIVGMVGSISYRSEPKIPIPVSGTGGVSCGLVLRVSHDNPLVLSLPWTSRTVPIAPSRIHSTVNRILSSEWPWLPI